VALRWCAVLATTSLSTAGEDTPSPQRPSLFITASPKPGLRSLADVRRGIRDGHARKLWEALVAKAERERDEPPIAPVAWVDGTRVEINRSFDFVAVPANRILDAALVALIREDRDLAQSTLRQIEVLFD